MASSTLVIPRATSELPTCNPNLMPFHISYTGPALVSGYMRVEKYKRDDASIIPKEQDPEAKEEVKADCEMKDPGTPETVVATSAEGDGAELKRPALAVVPSTDSVMTEATLVSESQDTASTVEKTTEQLSAPLLEDEDRRFVSTFRGRSIHGLTIDLPEGYSGLVLRADANSNKQTVSESDEVKTSKAKGKGKAPAAAAAATTKGKSNTTKSKTEANTRRGRLTRSAVSKRVEEPIEVDDDEEPAKMEEDQTVIDVDDTAVSTGEALPDVKPVKKLMPTSQFSSFTLWHPDRPVDKGSDEYARTLREWLALAHEINRTDL
ncbi:hypothetical protein CPC08DRAFT_816506 [Agrocybe pediades]|nr:hypothetical protein CPC08DRAFT_816506 [Agrocybe pediades]